MTWIAYADADGNAQLADRTEKDGTWNIKPVVPPPGNTPLQPTGPLALLYDGKDTLWLTYVAGNQFYTTSSKDGGPWSKPVQPGLYSCASDAMSTVYFEGKLYVAYLNENTKPAFMALNATGGWENKKAIGTNPAGASQRPGVTVWSGKLWFSYSAAADGEMQIIAYDGTKWSALLNIGGGAVESGTSILGAGDELWVAFIGEEAGSNNTYLRRSSDAVFWTEPECLVDASGEGKFFSSGAPVVSGAPKNVIGGPTFAANISFRSAVKMMTTMTYPAGDGAPGEDKPLPALVWV